MNRLISPISAVLLLTLTLAVGACGASKSESPEEAEQAKMYKYGSVLGGEGGISLFGSTKRDDGSQGNGLAINSFLWRASLDTLSFIPLASADPFGGVILTEWYSPPETPTDRIKVTVYILDRQLRADALKVTVFRQHQEANGTWRDTGVGADTAGKLEDTILTRARQLRIAQKTD